ncbi:MULTISPECIES: c-type cytochrome [unclassified Frigoribacterium]|jgi:ubiquinol-cytochrome c reductase cytochrome c subunit|uniref:cytochrome bc1 complex diheme cytochrome c subunit n=1 Tax=unclassified Frigoribacterium TaxID=2627005 RepID=UPI00105E5189|nr:MULTISPECIES: c-type cytochrome [unclassified Frigoribacterium]MBD8609056.1 c-type cytochrome [Frigoribacterium sp. CFBP 13729]TDT65418.1 menaquinol-cytochrome c reductase cytochrome c1 subunit precursor [Frigoribacterium sp. PhB116]
MFLKSSAATSSPEGRTPKRRPAKTGRRSPLATASLLLVGLLTTGGAYALFSSTATADESTTSAASQQSIDEGQKLFASNCATCHGLAADGTGEGPSLIGVGAASVDFQVGTGRMPMAANGPQAEEKPTQFTDDQVYDLAAYVASLAPGPAIPDEEYLQADGDTTNGAELFRINCAMCHNVAGAGGALTEGKYAPALDGVSGAHIYEAMLTGPQNMPVFNDLNLSPQDKADVITYLKYLENNPSPGGFELGSLGPVAEGLFIWIFGLGAIVAVTIWLTARSN